MIGLNLNIMQILFNLLFFSTFVTSNCVVQSEKVFMRVKKATDKEFLIYLTVNEATGFCLVVTQGWRNAVIVRIIRLQKTCLSGSAAARWIYLGGGLFQNVQFFNCLSAERTTFGNINGRLTLKPCDKASKFQTFACDSSCRVTLKMSSSSATYTLDHEIVSAEFATPRLRLGAGNHIASTWTIYDKRGQDFTCICNAPITMQVGAKNKIVTIKGGKVVGKPCVFPFIYNGKNIWQCINRNSKFICATNRNFDRYPNSWGVCPLAKRGTFSDYLLSSMCDKPCGGGRVYKQRKCLFPPCKGPLVGIQEESCNVQQCTGDQILTVGGHSYQFPVESVLRLVDGGHISICKFPFVLEGRSTETCISDHRRKKPWCSLTSNFDKHQKWGFCVDETKGVWSSWLEEMSCSKTCGKGHSFQTRKCHQPPCSGKSRLLVGTCNTQPCPECFRNNGQKYRGEKNVANDGTLCQYWKSQSPHTHPVETPSRYSELVHNYCRNPRRRGILPYCYRDHQSSPNAMYCDLVPCGANVDQPGVPYTIPVSFSDKHSLMTPCVFPFFYINAWYDSCVFLDEKSKGREKCKVVIGGAGRFRYCPSFVRGKWSDWIDDGDCTKSCGSGIRISFRRCLLSPCVGKAIRFENTKLCNTHPCTLPGSKDCFTGRGVTYDKTFRKTLSGHICQQWSEVPLHSSILFNAMLPLDVPRLTENYCRNPLPSLYFAPWCFIEGHEYKIWEYCDIPKCPAYEGEIFGFRPTIFKPQRILPCIFPFLGADNKLHGKCISTNYFSDTSVKYCAFSLLVNYKQLIRNPIEPHRISDAAARARENQKIQNALARGFDRGTYGICPPATEGTWTSWARATKCSVECGGGFIVKIRHCRYPPCSGDSTMREKHIKCNEQRCPTCLLGSGKLYRGSVNKGYLGDLCMKWSRVNKDVTEFHPGKYPELQGSFCRNPGGVYPTPWCFRNAAENNVLIRIFCDVPHCLEKTAYFFTIPYTIPDKLNYPRLNHSGNACQFPYRYRGDWYHACFIFDKNRKLFVCPVVGNSQNRQSELGICPPRYVGKWSSWKHSSICSKPCGVGRKLFVRECLFPKCLGKKFKFEGKCMERKCHWNSGLRENYDCFVGEGTSYEGEAILSVTGAVCKHWMSQNIVHRYSGIGMSLNAQHCRNPSPRGYKYAPWCYTYATSEGQIWEYCDIPKCSAYEGEIIALGGPGGNRPCHFPFLATGFMHESCKADSLNIVLNGKVIRKKWYVRICATAANKVVNIRQSDSTDWGFCPGSYMGTVSAWTLARGPDICSRRCGGGQLRYRKKCRFDRCSSKTSYTKLVGSCNTEHCDDACVNGRGVDFRGKITFDEYQHRCRNWNQFNLSRFELAHNLFRTDHNYCRNIAPSRYKAPFCMITQAQVAVCDLPFCKKTRGVNTYGHLEGAGKDCQFPYLKKGRPVESCLSFGSVKTEKYCGVERGNNDVEKEKKYAKCSKYKIGTWGEWNPTSKCNRPCGGGKLFQWRLCRYGPCRGPSNRYIGKCNNFPCDKSRNCYDPRTKGIEFRGSDPQYTKRHNCKKFHYPGTSILTSCMTHQNRLPSLARPICLIKVHWSNQLQLKFCKVSHCPGTVEGPVMVQPVSDFQERPFSPCIFPFLYRGKQYHRCVNRAELLPPTQDGNRPKETTFWCGTIYDIARDPKEWGYCMNVDKGKWGRFKDTPQCTLFCKTFESRYCLFPPCVGPNLLVSLRSCPRSQCNRYSWGKWSHWTECERCTRVQLRYRNCIDNQQIYLSGDQATLHFCQGASVNKMTCPTEAIFCSHVFVYGQIREKEVLEMTRTYSRRKYLGKSSGVVSLITRQWFLVIMLCCVLFFSDISA